MKAFRPRLQHPLFLTYALINFLGAASTFAIGCYVWWRWARLDQEADADPSLSDEAITRRRAASEELNWCYTATGVGCILVTICLLANFLETCALLGDASLTRFCLVYRHGLRDGDMLEGSRTEAKGGTFLHRSNASRDEAEIGLRINRRTFSFE